jgi:Family of unknown function (DUF5947)
MTAAPPPGTRSGAALGTLRRIAATRPAAYVGERCDMCAEPIPDEHRHVVNLESRGLMCTCRACYLLFTDPDAELRYRAVPERYLSFPGFVLGQREYDELEIPVGLAFLFRNSVLGRTVAFYPSPAGATESELTLDAWNRMVEANPQLDELQPDVEALLVRAVDGGRGGFACHLVPIDACYELVGRLRLLWRGFDGGSEVHQAMADFFAAVEDRSRPAPPIKDGDR